MNRRNWVVVAMVAIVLAVAPGVARAAGTAYYVDCSRVSDGGGTQAAPWNSLSTVSSFPFAAGDSVLFQRGVSCSGALLFARTGVDQKYAGLVSVLPGVGNSRFDHVEIDGVEAHNTTMWAGIIAWGIWIDGDRQWARKAKDPAQRSSNVIIRNSTVHDTYGDGIVTYMGRGVLMEHNVAYRTGSQPTETIGTPNAIWTWASNDVVVQYNEAYDNNSPGADGGAIDITTGVTTRRSSTRNALPV